MINKFTDDYGYQHDYGDPEYVDPRNPNDVDVKVYIYDKDGKVVGNATLNYNSKADALKNIQNDAQLKAEEIIDQIRPMTDDEAAEGLRKIKAMLNGESFSEFFRSKYP
jgi:hypothetical protein